MYIYDIPYAKADQYTLLFHGVPINVSKNTSYLKNKMKAHRDEMGPNEEGSYTIIAPDGTTAYSRTFAAGEKGYSSVDYHVVSQKPKQKPSTKTVYLYESQGPITEVERKGEYPITTFEAICEDDGSLVTDLTLLKLLGDVMYLERIPVMLTNRALVGLATYMPETKEEFVKLKGLGEKTYNKCGERLMAVIAKYRSKKNVAK